MITNRNKAMTPITLAEIELWAAKAKDVSGDNTAWLLAGIFDPRDIKIPPMTLRALLAAAWRGLEKDE